LADQRTESKVKEIEKELKPFLISAFRGTYDFDDWREKREGETQSSTKQAKIKRACKRTRKAKEKRQTSQKEIKYQKSYENKERVKEQQQFQQIEINLYKK
jgi:hypothetical protein